MTETIWPNLREDNFIIRDFRFASGETLPELRQRYFTLGTPAADAAGRIANAVLLIHNTTGTAKTWLEPALGGELFGPGQPLDAAKHFLIVPDIIGFGGSKIGRAHGLQADGERHARSGQQSRQHIAPAFIGAQ